MLINRYLCKEIAYTFFAVLSVILLIAVCNKVVRLLIHAASGEIAPKVLLQVILFQIPDLLAVMCPIALFLAILLSFGRFFMDNEIPVMLACGVSWQKLLNVALSMGIVVMILSAIITCYIGPIVAQQREALLQKEGPLFLVQTVTPGRFHSLNNGKLVFYVAQISDSRSKLKRLFIAEEPEKKSAALVSAKEGNVITYQDNGLTYIALKNGRN